MIDFGFLHFVREGARENVESGRRFRTGAGTRGNFGIPGSGLHGAALGAEVQIFVEPEFEMRSRLQLSLELLVRQNANRLGPSHGIGTLRVEFDDGFELIKSPAGLGVKIDGKIHAIEIVVLGQFLEAVANFQVAAGEFFFCNFLDDRQLGKLRRVAL